MAPNEKVIALADGREVAVRVMEERDAEAFFVHRIATCGETDFLAQWPDEVEVDVERELGIIRSMREDPRSCFLVVELDGRIAGMAGINPVAAGREKFAHRAQAAVSVVRTAWGLGIGSALMERLVELAPRMGYRQIELGVYAENERARALYERLGFRGMGVIPRAFIHRDGTSYDELQLVLMLDEH